MNNSVIATVVIVGGSTIFRVAYDPRVTNKPATIAKVAVAGFAAGALLTLVGGVAPTLASVLAWTLIIGALFVNGQAIMQATSQLWK